MDVSISYDLIAYGFSRIAALIVIRLHFIYGFYSVYGFVVYGAMLYSRFSTPFCCMLRIIIISFCRFHSGSCSKLYASSCVMDLCIYIAMRGNCCTHHLPINRRVIISLMDFAAMCVWQWMRPLFRQLSVMAIY